jgi:hypothetical protein
MDDAPRHFTHHLAIRTIDAEKTMSLPTSSLRVHEALAWRPRDAALTVPGAGRRCWCARPRSSQRQRSCGMPHVRG